MLSIQCALCGKKQKTKEIYKENFSTNQINAQIFSARRSPDKLHYRFVKCLNCGLIFSNPVLSPKKVENLYKESKFNYNLESKFLKKTYGELLIKELPKKTISKLSLLEIGCGNGFFLEEAVKIGIKTVFGVEPSTDSVKKASSKIKKKIKCDILRPNLFDNNSFDIICFFHTLDHVINPNSFLDIIRRLLKRNGKVICVVHDTDGLSVRLFGERSPIFDIEHIYLFNKKNLGEIFKKNKLEPLQISSVKNRYPIGYWIRLTPISKRLKNYLIKFVYLSGLRNVPLTLNAGNMVIIAEKN